jgi:hypothetical protein
VRITEREAQAVAKILHRRVHGQYLGGESRDALRAGDLDQAAQQFGPEALVLEGIADQQGKGRLPRDGWGGG